MKTLYFISKKITAASLTLSFLCMFFAPPFVEAGVVSSRVNSTIVATGGTITTITDSTGTYKVHTFTTTGSDTFTVTKGAGKVWYLVVAGGGAGATAATGPSGGGGAGGMRDSGGYTYTVKPGSYTVTVGAGGTPGNSGGNSVFDTITSIGGGNGGGNYNASNGGSGGGAGYTTSTKGTGTAGQGNDGGSGGGAKNETGGGGGAGEAGQSPSGGASGRGGNGLQSSISGTATYYAGGGGGTATDQLATGGAGGLGGGGAGAQPSSSPGTSGTANTGGGGGGSHNQTRGSGGSGIVIIRYPINKTTVSPTVSTTSQQALTATGGTISTVTDSTGTYKVHTFTSSGTFQVTKGSGRVWYLVVAGGGSGGGTAAASGAGGGGGAGGYRSNNAYSYTVTPQSYTVTVGAGGTAVTGVAIGNNGSDSVFGTITSTGGGGGAGGTPSQAGATGGSGGGSYGYPATPPVGTTSGGSGTAGQGNSGGKGASDNSTWTSSGGGGGAGGTGGDAPTDGGGGVGGSGTTSTISGASVTYAGGGGGGAGVSGKAAGTAGGGGGAGGLWRANGTDATANTGGGGGGPGSDAAVTSGAGGSGIVIIRYPVAKATTVKAAPIAGLVGKWTFDTADLNWATGQAYDRSGRGNAGQLISMSTTTSPTLGKLGKALSFNGSSNYVNVGAMSVLNSATQVSICFWSKKPTAGSISQAGSLVSGSDGVWLSWFSDGNVYFNVRNGTSQNSSFTPTFTSDWVHLCGTYDGSAASPIKIYLNGVSQTVSTSGGVPSSLASDGGTAMTIGALPNVSQFATGSMDEVRVYNRALSAAEVLQLYNSR